MIKADNLVEFSEINSLTKGIDYKDLNQKSNKSGDY